MTDIIDKVAEAIENEDLRIQAEGGGKALATAALEALAEGLVWKEGNTVSSLYFSNLRVEGAHQIDGLWYTDGLGILPKRSDAKTAIINHARRVLFGLGPVGEGND